MNLLKRIGFYRVTGLTSVSLLAGLVGVAAIAQAQANFDSATLPPGSTESLSGYTQGSTPLAAIATQDNAGNLCVGFSASEPDHVLTLPAAVSELSLQVNSNGGDTTLLMQGPNQRGIQCGDDTGSNPDASIRGRNMQPGEYRIWVGAFDAGVRHDYTLTIRSTP